MARQSIVACPSQATLIWFSLILVYHPGGPKFLMQTYRNVAQTLPADKPQVFISPANFGVGGVPLQHIDNPKASSPKFPGRSNSAYWQWY